MLLVDRIRDEAARLGFAACAFAPADRLTDDEARLRDWLAKGFAGTMSYLTDATARCDPGALLGSARSVIVCALPYQATSTAPDGPAPHGRVARYAGGEDYHRVLKERLRALAGFIARATATEVLWRACVDTAPLLERALAARAGLGFVAKNAMIITPGVGSYTLLGELVVSIDLPEGVPQPSRCGRCTACLDVCPTGALVGDRLLDARRCISYLTIELDGPIPRELRPLIGDWVFGCDLCQSVCPFNAAAPADLVPADLRPRPSRSRPALAHLLALGTNQFKRFVEGSALRRVRRRQLLRNAAVALGNVGGPADEPALAGALADREPLVRGHAAWALGRLGLRDPLERALKTEMDPFVREEVDAALACHYLSRR
jgi:epoxyqueuosine reductase